MFGAKGAYLIVSLACLSLGCRERKADQTNDAAVPSAEASASSGPKATDAQKAMASPLPEKVVKAVTNPKNAAAYAGKYGTLRGVVKVTGDEAPSLHDELKDVPKDCPRVEGMYAKVFREGPDRVLADALVAVTGYDAYLPPKAPFVRIEGSGCAWNTRTIAVMYGQGLEVAAVDRKPYVPDIHDQGFPAQLFALPDQEPIRLVPKTPGRFLFYDAMRLYARADLFVLPYPTAAVSDVSGRFEIKDLPVGKLQVNALLPATDAVATREIEIKEGTVTEVELTVEFKAAAYKPKFINAKPKASPY